MKTKQQQKDEAYVAFQAIRDPAYVAFRAITDPAYEIYKAKCREIDEQADEDIKIIDGKKNKLIKE